MTDRNKSTLSARIHALASEAQRATGFQAHTSVGFQEPRHYLPVPAARSMPIKLSTQNVAELIDKEGRIHRTPRGSAVGAVVPMSAAIIARSIVANSGAHIIVREDSRTPISTGKDIVFQRVPSALRLVEAATFTHVPDGGDLATSAIPVSEAEIDFADSPSHGVRFEVPRSKLKRVGEEITYHEISIALTLGLAKLADAELMKLLAAADLAEFSLSRVAEQGIRFDEVRAIVGSGAHGAAVGADGVLRVAGLPASLTNAAEMTFAGAWDCAGIAIRDNVELLIERTNTHGSTAFTVWANVVPLVPDASKFWKVTA